jgi:hypothetical protein
MLGLKPRSYVRAASSLGVVVHAFNPSTQEAEAGGFLSSRPAWSTKWIPGQPGLHREILSQKTKKKKKKQPVLLTTETYFWPYYLVLFGFVLFTYSFVHSFIRSFVHLGFLRHGLTVYHGPDHLARFESLSPFFTNVCSAPWVQDFAMCFEQ